MRYSILLLLVLFLHSFTSGQTVVKKRLGFVPYTDPDFADEEYRESVYKNMYDSALRIFINTQRFIILDRGSFNVLKIEKDFQKGDDLINSEIIKQGKVLAAEILAVAKITTLSVDLNSDGKTYSAFIVCEFKQIDVESGRAVAALQLQGSSSEMIGKKPSSADEAIVKAVKKMEKDLEKWVRESFPLAMNVLSVDEVKMELTAEGGRETGLSKLNKLRAVRVQLVGGKKVVTTLARLAFTKESLGEETTKLIISDKLEWEAFRSAWKANPSEILVFEDNR